MASPKLRDWRTKVRRNFLEGKVSFPRLDFHLPFPFPPLLSFPLALNRLEDRDRGSSVWPNEILIFDKTLPSPNSSLHPFCCNSTVLFHCLPSHSSLLFLYREGRHRFRDDIKYHLDAQRFRRRRYSQRRHNGNKCCERLRLIAQGGLRNCAERDMHL